MGTEDFVGVVLIQNTPRFRVPFGTTPHEFGDGVMVEFMAIKIPSFVVYRVFSVHMNTIGMYKYIYIYIYIYRLWFVDCLSINFLPSSFRSFTNVLFYL